VRLHILISTLLLAARVLFGQQYPFLLVPNSPKTAGALMEDSRGRLWVGATDDAVIFDGSRFYSLHEAGFPAVEVTSFAEDDEGGVWIGTEAGLYRFHAGRVAQISPGRTVNVAFLAPGVVVAAIHPSLANDAAADYLYQLFRIRREQELWKVDRLSNWIVNRTFTVDRNGTLLFGCEDHWCELPRDVIVEWHSGSPAKPAAMLGMSATRIVRDRFGCIWFRSEARMFNQCPGDSTIRTLPSEFASAAGGAFFTEASDGSMLIPSYSSLTVGRPEHFQTARASNGYPAAGRVIEARDGSLWLAGSDGLYRFADPFRTEFWSAREGLEAPLAVASIGGRHFAGYSQGIRMLSEDRTRWIQVPRTSELGMVVQVSEGPGETILANGTNIAMLRSDGTVLVRDNTHDVFRLVRTPDGKMWMSGASVGLVSRRGAGFLIEPQLPIEKNSMGMDMEYSPQTNTLWTCYGGLVGLTGKTWRRFTKADGLLDNRCMSLAALANGDVWFGYLGSPWFALVRETGSNQVTVRNFGSSVFDMTFLDADRRGWLWRGSNRDGVHVADPIDAENDNWIDLTSADGLPSISTNQQSFYDDPDGSVWWAADNTITHFSPGADLVHPTKAPLISVSALSLNGGAPKLTDLTSLVPHGSSIIAHIGTLQFDRRNAIRLRYRMLPESTWKDTRSLDLTLGTLGWGGHTLEVQARLGTGPWSTTSSQTITVMPPVWATWPYLSGFSFAGLALGIGAFQWNKKRLEIERRILPDLGSLRMAALVPEANALIGTTLDGRYTSKRLLARGGFATVFDGEDLERNRRCAIKVFHQEVADHGLAKRFQQEVAALESIEHPNVVRIYGHGSTPTGIPYLVMEFIEGSTLGAAIPTDGLPAPRVASLLRQIGNALGAIHAHGICHRDLKPDNLMIRAVSAANEDLVLIDFSIAIVKSADESVHGLSRAAGTIQYMAPEQAVGYADASSDLYSLAKVTVEMITGKRLSELLPNASLDLPERMREAIAKFPVPLSKDSADLICSALQFDPSRRPANAVGFASRIARDLEGDHPGSTEPLS
jgi:hypothetical protein